MRSDLPVPPGWIRLTVDRGPVSLPAGGIISVEASTDGSVVTTSEAQPVFGGDGEAIGIMNGAYYVRESHDEVLALMAAAREEDEALQ